MIERLNDREIEPSNHENREGCPPCRRGWICAILTGLGVQLDCNRFPPQHFSTWVVESFKSVSVSVLVGISRGKVSYPTSEINSDATKEGCWVLPAGRVQQAGRCLTLHPIYESALFRLQDDDQLFLDPWAFLLEARPVRGELLSIAQSCLPLQVVYQLCKGVNIP